MFHLNKIIWFLVNPVMLSVLLGIISIILIFRCRIRLRKIGYCCGIAAVLMLWFFNTLSAVAIFGRPLEDPYYSMQDADVLPTADAIVLLGGGIVKNDHFRYPDLADAGDRVWHAARLYNMKKAPVIVVSGIGDRESTLPLLLDLGVPNDDILVDDESRNTYENARYTEKLLAGRNAGKKVLLVTSAWHMTRALGNFSKTDLECIPAPADFKSLNLIAGSRWWDWIVPSPGYSDTVNALVKEWLGRFARK